MLGVCWQEYCLGTFDAIVSGSVLRMLLPMRAQSASLTGWGSDGRILFFIKDGTARRLLHGLSSNSFKGVAQGDPKCDVRICGLTL